MNPENVIITGAGGFVGGALARHYSEKGKKVTNLSRRDLDGIDSVRVDLGDSAPDFTPPDPEKSVLIHSAASMNTSNLQELWGANVLGSANLFRWAADHGIGHVVFISSGGVYPYRNDHAWGEEESVDPIGHYGYTKYMGESIARMHSKIDGLSVSVLRLFFPFDLEGTGGMSRMFVDRLSKKLEFQINEGGKPAMNPVYIEDFVDLVDRAVQKGGDNGFEIYNAAGAEVLTFREMCGFFENVVGKQAKTRDTGNVQEDLIGSIEKAKKDLDWEPQFRFNQ